MSAESATPAQSKARPWTKPEEPKGAGAQINELKTLVVGYAKQETVDPLKTLGRYLGFGISGSVVIGVGIFLWLLALLRGLQSIEFFNDGTLEGGTWSWLPYLITTAVGALIALAFLMKLLRVANGSSTHTPRGPT